MKSSHDCLGLPTGSGFPDCAVVLSFPFAMAVVAPSNEKGAMPSDRGAACSMHTVSVRCVSVRLAVKCQQLQAVRPREGRSGSLLTTAIGLVPKNGLLPLKLRIAGGTDVIAMAMQPCAAARVV